MLFTQHLQGSGFRITLAEHLYIEDHLTLGRAAEMAGTSYIKFAEHLSALGITVVDYPPEDLEDELNCSLHHS